MPVSINRSITLLLLLLCSLSFLPHAQAQTEESGLIAKLRLDQPLQFCGEKVPLEDAEVRERLEKELLISLWDRDQAILWLKRSSRYLPTIEKLLREAGLPDDLKYISLAESALRPHVGSVKGAIGFWQFMPATAKRYGLTVNKRTDQRRNLIASTTAAIHYLRDLYAQFGAWNLAAAAYNMGEGGLEAAMLMQDESDYYRLYLPLETQRYLFRIYSVKLILEQPERFGFAMQPDDYYRPRPSKSVVLNTPEETSLTLVAKAAASDFKQIKDLNPELRGYYLAAGKHQLRVPPKAPDDFQQRFDVLHKNWQDKRSQNLYTVQPGDSLSQIAERFNVPLAVVTLWNQINLRKTLHPGDRLVIEQKGVAD